VNNKIFNVDHYAKKAREAVAEGIVLLKHEGKVLPLSENSKIAVFGRTQFNYYKSGTGSGGLVNTSYVTGILEALERDASISVNQAVKKQYEEWLKENPFDEGSGWASEPWFQKEMLVSEELIQQAKQESEIAIIIIGRTAGEDKDNKAEEGSYYLTGEERMLLKQVCENFQRSIVLLNVGSIIDMKWVEEYCPAAVLYVWQGGQEGGNGVLDVLKGTVSPSGKLTDTIAYQIEDYPSAGCYGDEKCNHYIEDIYVGYRYFETFAREKVMYPFGFGLSYTTFSKALVEMREGRDQIEFQVRVTNTGAYQGKEVAQLYVKAPQGKLGKPLKSLCGFQKTGNLMPGDSETLSLLCSKYSLSSYDDSGVTGYKSSYVLEAGSYDFYLGDDVRSSSYIGSIQIEEIEVVEALQEALAPVVSYKRMKPALSQDQTCSLVYEEVPKRTVDPKERRVERMPGEIAYTGDQGWKLGDVADGKVSMEGFIAQLSDEDLCCISRGEGMCSPKVTPGTAGAFGGVTEGLANYGIPAGCCADGPSGIRMDCGTVAFSLPNGTCLASTFNEALVQELFEYEGLELRKDRVDTLLGPGMNLHRNPLNGRNFEYFSEDPLLTGKIAAAQLRGMHKYGVTGTIKHFACNNQEYKRTETEAVVSERALREVYLKGFEIAVKEGGAYSIMSSYGPINGLWTASNYDLLTTILRNEWKFDGIVMTDWWAKGNDEGENAIITNTSAMIRSQNDLIMVTADSKENTSDDNSAEGLRSGKVTRAEFQRSAMNICRALMKLPAFARVRGVITELDEKLQECITPEDEAVFRMQQVKVEHSSDIDVDKIETRKGSSNPFQVFIKERGIYEIKITCRANTRSEVAQLPLSVFYDKKLEKTITLTGEDTQWRTFDFKIGPVFNNNFYLKLYFGQSGMEIKECTISLVESYEDKIRAYFAGQA
jgi:beta-glucosidase